MVNSQKNICRRVLFISVRSKYSEIRCHYVASLSVTQLSTKRLGNYTVIGLESRGVSKIDVCVPLQQVLALGLFGGCVWYRNARFYLDTSDTANGTEAHT